MEALIPCSILESNDIIVLRSYVSYMYYGSSDTMFDIGIE